MKIKFYFLLLLFSAHSFGQISDYNYKRELFGIEEPWHKITLPNEVFGKISHDFSDIRIFGLTKNNDTIEAPYVLQLTKEKIVQNEVLFKIINQSKNQKGYYFTFEIPTENAINQMQLSFKQQNFDWLSTLEGSQNLDEWFTISDDYRILSIKNEGADFQFTTLKFPSSKYRYYRLLVQSKSELDLVEAKIVLNEMLDGNFRKYTIQSTEFEEEKQNKQTIIQVALKSKVPVSKLKIYVKDSFDYYRPITIKYLKDSIKTEKGWKYNYSTLTSGTLNSIEKNEFKFESTMLKKLKISIENRDNRPLQIDSLVVEGYVHELVTRFIDPATYFLTYGNNEVSKPFYDINSFTDKIPTSVTQLKIGDEQIIEKSPKEIENPLFQNKNWLWAIMVLIIALLGWFSLKMMKQNKT
uniref:DUF3999 family protein n=2 Tax=Flavobacterium sp. TaxID=239 RepID=UPI00404B3D97